MDRYCVDCHHRKSSINNNDICGHPYVIVINNVNGKILYPLCKDERAYKIDSVCRPEGRLFRKIEKDMYIGEV